MSRFPLIQVSNVGLSSHDCSKPRKPQRCGRKSSTHSCGALLLFEKKPTDRKLVAFRVQQALIEVVILRASYGSKQHCFGRTAGPLATWIRACSPTEIHLLNKLFINLSDLTS